MTFDTRWVGPLTVKREDAGYAMDFPSRPGEEVTSVPDFVLDALVPERPIAARKARDLMLVYPNEETVRTLKPDFTALRPFEPFIIVTAACKEEPYDFISRFFCSKEGISEDPVTGSAHCTSAPYWAKVLGKKRMKAYQASKRGGVWGLHLEGERLHIHGEAVTVFEGHC